MNGRAPFYGLTPFFVVFNLTEKLATQFLPPLRLGVTSAPPLNRSGD